MAKASIASVPAESPVKRAENGGKAQVGAFHRPELDTLRFFAFLGVFAQHTLPTTSSAVHRHLPAWAAKIETSLANAGAYGVDLFFLLSAYLITELLIREKESVGALNVRAFYVRRILRIWPLYYFVLPIVALVPLFNPSGQFSLRYVIPFLLFVGNWSVVMFGWPMPMPAANPLWSVSVEEQFYLAWAPVVARLSRTKIAIASTIMILVANITRIMAFLLHRTSGELWANTFAHLDSMAVGILLALMLHGRAPKISNLGRISLVASGILFLAIRSHFGPDPFQPLSFLQASIGYPTVVAACTAVMFAFIGLPLRSKALEYLGKISYGLYVYHLMCIFLVERLLNTKLSTWNFLLGNVTALVLTIVVAAVSYALLEKPFLMLKRRFTYVSSRPA